MPVFSAVVPCFAVVAILALAIGVWLLVLGVRPRRVGSEPRCRRCEYNLTGLTSDRCPECGAQLDDRSTIHGVRHRRPALAIGGMLLILVSLSPLVAAVSDIDWYRYKPTSWVIRELDTANRTAFSRAWSELMRRDTAGTISVSNQRALVAACLAEQGKPANARIDSRLIDYLGDCLLRGSLTPVEQEQFFDQITLLELHARSPVRLGQPAVYRLEHTSRGPSANLFWVETRCTNSWIDDEQQPGGEIGLGRTAGIGAGGSFGTSIRYDVPGQHTLRVAAKIRTYSGPWGDEDASTLHDKRTHMLETEFTVVESSQEDLIEAIVDPACADDLHQCITIEELECSGEWLKCSVEIELPPVPIAFEVYAQCDEREFRLGTLCRLAGSGAMNRHMSSPLDGPCPDGPCTITLRASADVVERSVDSFAYWVGELVFEGVEVADEETAAD